MYLNRWGSTPPNDQSTWVYAKISRPRMEGEKKNILSNKTEFWCIPFNGNLILFHNLWNTNVSSEMRKKKLLPTSFVLPFKGRHSSLPFISKKKEYWFGLVRSWDKGSQFPKMKLPSKEPQNIKTKGLPIFRWFPEGKEVIVPSLLIPFLFDHLLSTSL